MTNKALIITSISLVAGIVAFIAILSALWPNTVDTKEAAGMKTATKAAGKQTTTQKATAAVSSSPKTSGLPKTFADAQSILARQFIDTTITQDQIDAANAIIQQIQLTPGSTLPGQDPFSTVSLN